jgi:hypothetical protein
MTAEIDEQMIEAGARAICAYYKCDPDELVSVNGLYSGPMLPRWKVAWVGPAKAAITAALRCPR